MPRWHDSQRSTVWSPLTLSCFMPKSKFSMEARVSLTCCAVASVTLFFRYSSRWRSRSPAGLSSSPFSASRRPFSSLSETYCVSSSVKSISRRCVRAPVSSVGRLTTDFCAFSFSRSRRIPSLSLSSACSTL